MYKTDRYLNTDIHLYEQTNEKVQLLQSDKRYPLSEFYLEGKEVKALINCSYFSADYVLGRNQGDLYNNTYNSSEDNKWCDVVFFNDNSFIAGKFSSGDYRNNVSAGFSPAVLKVNGKLMYSDLISNAHSRMTTRSQQTAIAITNENKLILFVSEGRNVSDFGLTGTQVFEYLESHYNTKVVALLDGGGSSEMIVDKKIMNFLNGGERPMFNGLALYVDKQETIEDNTDKVLDVSSFQENIDYAKVKASGIKGVILRCGRTYWGQCVVASDACFEKHYKGFRAVEMPIGVYYYSSADTIEKAKEEAHFVLNVIKDKKLEYPIYFDVENNERQKGLSTQALTDIANTFCEIIEKAGYYVGIYASASWLKHELYMDQLPYDVWVAHYGVNKPSYEGNYGMWQFTSKGHVSGIEGDVDLSYCYLDYPKIIKESGLNHLQGSEIDDLKAQVSVLTSELVKANQTIKDREIEIIKLENMINEIRKVVNV